MLPVLGELEDTSVDSSSAFDDVDTVSRNEEGGGGGAGDSDECLSVVLGDGAIITINQFICNAIWQTQ